MKPTRPTPPTPRYVCDCGRDRTGKVDEICPCNIMYALLMRGMFFALGLAFFFTILEIYHKKG